MKKIFVFLAAVIMATSAQALDIAGLANKVQSVADKANAKLENVQTQNDEQKEAAANKIEEKIAALKEKIANWQSSDNADSSEIKEAIANAKASIEKLLAQLKALRGE